MKLSTKNSPFSDRSPKYDSPINLHLTPSKSVKILVKKISCLIIKNSYLLLSYATNKWSIAFPAMPNSVWPCKAMTSLSWNLQTVIKARRGWKLKKSLNLPQSWVSHTYDCVRKFSSLTSFFWLKYVSKYDLDLNRNRNKWN